MKANYDFGRLGITENNKREYIKLLELNQDYFVPGKYLQMDKVSIEIKYDLTGLISYEQLTTTNEVFIMQAMLGLAKLCTHANEMFDVDLSRDNIYFDQGANAYQLVRKLSSKQNNEQQLVLDIKSLLGNLYLKDSYENIHASNGKLLEKSPLLGSLVDIDQLRPLEHAISTIIAERMQVERKTLVFVNKNYINRIKQISRIKTLLILILVIVAGYLAIIFIPNRTSQLHAIDSYEATKYEDVLASLKATDVKTMSPVMKYVMAQSTVKLSQLSDVQKDNILFNLSPSVEENILDFWVYIGQGALEDAYDQSIKNNDAQQKAYVLLLLIDQTQNDASLKTTEKENKLSTYQGELDAITSSIKAAKEKA